MSDRGHQEFIEHACEAFQENDELQLTARNRMSNMLNLTDTDLERANQNLRIQPLSKLKLRLKIVVIIMLLFSAGIVAYFVFNDSVYKSMREMSIVGGDHHMELAESYSHLSADEKFTLLGAPGDKTWLEASKSRIARDPENAAYYIEYLGEHHNRYNRHPKDILERGEKIDPDNSLYPILLAAELSATAIKDKRIAVTKHLTVKEKKAAAKLRRERRAPERKAREENQPLPPKTPAPVSKKPKFNPEMVILDQEKYNQALQFFYQAVEKPIFTERGVELMNERVPLLNSKIDSLGSSATPFLYVAWQKSLMIEVRRISDLVVCESQRCEREKDRAGLKRLIEAHEIFGRQLLADGNVTFLHALITRFYFRIVHPHLCRAAKECGLDALAKKYSDLEVAFKKDKLLKESQDFRTVRNAYRKHASVTAGRSASMMLHHIRDQSAISLSNHEPLRRAEHAYAGQVVMILVWTLFSMLALVFFLSNLCKNKLIKGYSARLLGVFGWQDWVIIFLLGIIAPIGFYYYINGYSPWNITQYNVLHNDGSLIGMRSVCLVVFLICSQVLVIEWRLAKLTGKVFGRQSPWLIWSSLILALIFFFALEIAELSNWENKWFTLIGLSLFSLISYVFLKFMPGLFSYKNGIVSRAIVVSFILTSATVTLLLPIYKAEEMHWVAEDEIMKLDPNRVSYSKLESEVTMQYLKELKALLGY